MDPSAFGIEERRLILGLDQIRVASDGIGLVTDIIATVTLRGGELALVRVEQASQASAFVDVCVGLIPPLEGSVQFLGHDWTTLPITTINILRGRIGRVFGEQNWLANLSLLDNILLSALHHTRRSVGEIREEAANLAKQFNLPGIPIGYPREFGRVDLQRAACVKAFLGSPSLVILEDPTFGVFPDIMGPLINAIRYVRSMGSAVIWLTCEQVVWMDTSLPATHRYRFAGQEVIKIMGRQ